MNSQANSLRSPDPASLDAIGQNLALIFAAAKESGQSEVVVREAIAVLGNASHPLHHDLRVFDNQQPAG